MLIFSTSFFHPVGYFHRIGSRLFLNCHADSRNAVETRQGSSFFHAVFRPADIPYPNRRAFVITDNQIIKIRNFGKFAFNPDSVFLGLQFQCDRPAIQYFPVSRARTTSAGSNLIGLHFSSIQPDAHLPQTQTIENNITDAVDSLQLFFQNFIGIRGKISNRLIPGKIQ